MMRKSMVLVLIIVMVWVAVPTNAQSPFVAADLPLEHRLTGLEMMWQQMNRCSATALFIQMSYFDPPHSATDILRWLNPYNEDMSVRLDELIDYAGTQGLLGIERTGGTFDLMQRVLLAGFPILVENAYWHRVDNNDWMSHNRIMIGYDGGSFYFFDPLLGPGENQQGYAIRYEEFDERWRDFNRNYMILYRPEQEALLMETLGDQWDETLNAEWTLEQAQAEYEQRGDAFSAYNVGSALNRLERFEEAAHWFDTARATGLPWRMHWYRFEAFEGYLGVGRWDDVVTLTYEVLDGSDQIQEVYYYIGLAAQGMGDIERARANFYAALAKNANYPAAQAAIDALPQ